MAVMTGIRMALGTISFQFVFWGIRLIPFALAFAMGAGVIVTPYRPEVNMLIAVGIFLALMPGIVGFPHESAAGKTRRQYYMFMAAGAILIAASFMFGRSFAADVARFMVLP